jgi:hypothetical protein
MRIEISEYEMLVLEKERYIKLADIVDLLMPAVLTETRDSMSMLVRLDIGLMPLAPITKEKNWLSKVRSFSFWKMKICA